MLPEIPYDRMNSLNNIEYDNSLWESYKKGNRDAFGKLFQLHYPSLYQFGARLTADHDLIEDSIQELFIELWQNKSEGKIISVKAYLLKALKYKIFRALQKKSARPSLLADETAFEFSHEFLLIQEEEKTELHNKMVNVLNRLPPRQKEIIYLKYYQELSYEEVSEIMNINYQASRNLLYQALKALKNMLGGSLFLFLAAL